MKISFILLLCCVVLSTHAIITPPGSTDPLEVTTNTTEENWCISGNGMVICGSVRVAGAIDYLAWNGRQFINAYDHGRELQIAITNASGECYNPTEAGSSDDGAGPSTTSQLLGVNTAGNVYRTTSLPAFWLRPGQRDPNGCIAVNTSPLSNYRTSKAIMFSNFGVSNALIYLISITVPEHQTYLQVEAPTGYMPGNNQFNTFWTLSLATNQLTQVNQGPAETLDPVIISTPDQQYAMGAYLAGAPSQYAHYARFNFPNSLEAAATSKWSNVWRGNMNFVPGQVLSFESIICVGNLASVRSCMIASSQKTGWIHGTS